MAPAPSAPSSSPIRRSLRDQRSRLSAAHLLLKLKPSNISVVDFIRSLQARRNEGVDPCIDPRCEHKEQLSAWKQKCAQAEQKAAKLQRTLVELGKANQKLQEGLKAQESSKANSQRKRKRQDSLDEPFARNGRRKIGGLSEQIAEAGSGSLGFLDVSSSSPEVEKCLGNLYIFQSVRGQQSPDLEELTSSLICLSVDCSSIMEALHKRESSGDSKNVSTRSLGVQESDVFVRARLVRATFSKILDGVSFLRDKGETARCSCIGYSITKLLNEALDLIREACATPVRKQDAAKKANKGRKRAQPAMSPLKVPQADVHLFPFLCHLVIDLLQILSTDERDHQAIWDGVLSHLLRRVGALLHTAVFGASLGSGGQSKILTETGSAFAHDKPIDLASEGPILVWLLRRALVQHGQRSSKVIRESTSSEKGSFSVSGHLGALSEAALKRLQQTLLKAVFPNDDDSFREALSAPVDATFGHEKIPQKINPEDAPNWFKSEVWRLVGWDVLRDMVAWDA